MDALAVDASLVKDIHRQEIEGILDIQSDITARLGEAGLLPTDVPWIMVPGTPDDVQQLHDSIAAVLRKEKFADIDWSEQPLYLGVRNESGHIDMVTRTLRHPSDRRMGERARLKSATETGSEVTVGAVIDRCCPEGRQNAVTYMLAGVANTSESGAARGNYRRMMEYRLAMVLADSLRNERAGKPLVIASTVRTENTLPGKPSSELLGSVCVQHGIPIEYPATVPGREIPTDVAVVRVAPNEKPRILRSLISAMHGRIDAGM